MDGAWLSYLFFVCVAIISAGLLWFRVARPILEDFEFMTQAETVKRSLLAHDDYVKDPNPLDTSVPPFRPEPEREPEPEPAAEPLLTRPAPAGTVYSDDQIERLKRAGRDQGAAEAIGLFVGMGLLPESRESAVMESLFGKRGRRWQSARPIIESAAAAAAPPPIEAKPILVRAGTADEYAIERQEPPHGNQESTTRPAARSAADPATGWQPAPVPTD